MYKVALFYRLAWRQRIFCLHSLIEGFSNVSGVAAAMARSCVVTDFVDAALPVSHTGPVVPKRTHECCPLVWKDYFRSPPLNCMSWASVPCSVSMRMD